jgi:eukaryotic-like serine/threonine-protein kinase
MKAKRPRRRPNPHAPSLAGRRLGAYQLLSLLATGGMGEVYRGYDPRLSRYVAVKVLRSELAQNRSHLNRFNREARAAARLNHPNILAIYDSGTARNLAYLVHELLVGHTLREQLRKKHFSIPDALSLASQIANGLAAAHAKQLVHRDLKPANLFITADGTVKILDFGLAKPTGRRGPSTRTDHTVTKPGSVLGSVGYMSPEQIRGHAVDHRTDIFSFGAVLFELLTGRRAFDGDSSIDVIGATLFSAVPDVSSNPLLNELVQRCLAKDPADRLQSCSDVQFMLQQLTRRVDDPARELPGLTRLALLPVRCDPPAEIDADRCAAATDAIIVHLVKLPDVRVISTESVRECQRRQLSIPALAEVIGADLIVEAAMVAGATVSCELSVRDATGQELWTLQVPGTLDDFLGLLQNICEALGGFLREKLSIRTPHGHAGLAEVAPAAHDLYMKALYHWRKYSPDGWAEAATWFRRSIAADPSYAPAFSGLANVTYSLGALQGEGVLAMGEYLTIKEATRRALELDPNLADAHAIDARVKWTPEWNVLEADAAFRRALTLNPSSAEVSSRYAIYLLTVGRLEDGLHYAEVAERLDPASIAAKIRLGNVMYNARQYSRSIDILRDALDLEPGLITVQVLLGLALVASDEAERAVPILTGAAAAESATAMTALSWALVRSGDKEQAEQVFNRLLQRRRQELVPQVSLAACAANLGRADEAIDWLQRAVRDRCLELIGLNIDPMFDVLRSDERFAGIVTSVLVGSEAILVRAATQHHTRSVTMRHA